MSIQTVIDALTSQSRPNWLPRGPVKASGSTLTIGPVLIETSSFTHALNQVNVYLFNHFSLKHARKATVAAVIVAGSIFTLDATHAAERSAMTIVQMASVTCADAQVDPNNARELIAKEALAQGVDPKLPLAIAQHESAFGAKTNSPAGARGIMQLMPATSARYGVEDVCDAKQNIRGGVSYLKDLWTLFDGNIMLVVAAYNAGENRVIDAGGIPSISETVNYTATVTNTYYGFQNAISGARAKTARQPKIDRADVLTVEAASDTPIPINSHQNTPTANNWLAGSVLYVQ